MMAKEHPWFPMMVPPSWSSSTLCIQLLTLPNLKMLRSIPYWIIIVLCLAFHVSIIQTFHASTLECCSVKSTEKFAKYGCCLLCFWNPKFQIGDGTMIVVLLIGKFLLEARPFVEDVVHPQLIICVFHTTSNLLESTNGLANIKNVTSLSPLTWHSSNLPYASIWQQLFLSLKYKFPSQNWCNFLVLFDSSGIVKLKMSSHTSWHHTKNE